MSLALSSLDFPLIIYDYMLPQDHQSCEKAIKNTFGKKLV